MNLVPGLQLVFDPTHESPDLIDERSPTDPTRQQTSGGVPMLPVPGVPLPVVADDGTPQAPLFHGWNVWDVLQSQAPIDPTPGSLDQQLADFVRDSLHAGPDMQVAKVSNAAAGGLVTSRSSIPELAGALHLGVGGSQVLRRTIAFEYEGDARTTIPWPRSMNCMLDAVYLPAPATERAPSDPVTTPATDKPALPVRSKPSSSASGVAVAVIGVGAVLVLLSRRRRK